MTLVCLIALAGPLCADVIEPVTLDTNERALLIAGERVAYYSTVVLAGPCGARRVFAYQLEGEDDISYRDGAEPAAIVDVECKP